VCSFVSAKPILYCAGEGRREGNEEKERLVLDRRQGKKDGNKKEKEEKREEKQEKGRNEDPGSRSEVTISIILTSNRR
jgi:hypothetical protein